MYKKTFILFFALLLFATQANTGSASSLEGAPESVIAYNNSKVQWSDPLLKDRIETYWVARLAKSSAENLFMLEAPHVQEMVDFKRYRAWWANLPRGEIDNINVLRKKQVSGHLFEIIMRIAYVHENGDNVRFDVQDHWVQVQDDWYHVLRNPLVFPELS